VRLPIGVIVEGMMEVFIRFKLVLNMSFINVNRLTDEIVKLKLRLIEIKIKIRLI